MKIRNHLKGSTVAAAMFLGAALAPLPVSAAGTCPIGHDVLACCIYLCQDHPFSHACELGCVVDDIVFGATGEDQTTAELSLIVTQKDGRREVVDLTHSRPAEFQEAGTKQSR